MNRISCCTVVLKGYDKLCNDIEKNQKHAEKAIRDKYIKPAEAAQKRMNKLASQKDSNFNIWSAHCRTTASNVISMGNVVNTCINMYMSAALAAAKKNYKQCRALYIKAATYNKKKSANEAALLEAYVDVSNYEVDMMMPEC
jgi:hypothetical protein